MYDRYKRKASKVASAAVLALAFIAPAIAQEGGWGSDVEDFSAPARPARITADGGDTDFSAALEAAAAAEGRASATQTPAAESKTDAATAEKKDFVPKNEVTVTKNPGAADSGTANPEKKKKEKKPKAEGSGEKLGHTMGARLGVGFDMDLSLGFGIGLSDVNRVGFGINMGWGVAGEYGFSTYEGFGFFDWNINLSDDGALRWFIGPGATFGFYGAEIDETHKVVIKGDTTSAGVRIDTLKYTNEKVRGDSPFSFGIGARTGLEVDLSFIDPDHALSMLRSSSVSLDVRLVLYLAAVTAEKNTPLDNYPQLMPTLGITYNYVFGGGKGKEKK
jgi:hypothetical protein